MDRDLWRSQSAQQAGVSASRRTRTWIVALSHLFGGRLISVPGCGLIDGCLAPSNAGRESLGLIVGFGDARGLRKVEENGEHRLSQDLVWNLLSQLCP